MAITAVLANYDGGTKYPGSGYTSKMWRAAIERLPAAHRAQIDEIVPLSRSLGRYIPSLCRMLTFRALRQERRVLVLGGDHSLTYSTAWAAREAVGEMSFVHFDAHHDSYNTGYLSNYSFAKYAPADFGHSWHGVGWRHDPSSPKPTVLDHEIFGDCWVSFDFDFFDPKFFGEVRFPVPCQEGKSVETHEFELSLTKVLGPVRGVDLLEWVPPNEQAPNDIVVDVLSRSVDLLTRPNPA
ncbi:arginase family protein [Streptomyces sp. NPDC001739]